ncbi:nucleoside/nucleotide kinase family protein [Insolitispirillum peregrinum]|uniref:hypothetical protein n=1 Tax=Insolitispirillum peregrinum TaxID=80876 RepID=UPI00362011B5
MSKRPVVATFDGPKSVGKSTLIHLLAPLIHTTGLKARVIVEKEVIPASISRDLKNLYADLRQHPGRQSDMAIAQALLEARVWITRTMLSEISEDIILLDRWYPSDTVFRRFLDPSEVIKANLAAGVLTPDVVLAVTCDPKTSWMRAKNRHRGLDSKVVSSFTDHAESTQRFVTAAKKYAWDIVQTDSKDPEELAGMIAARLQSVRLEQSTQK